MTLTPYAVQTYIYMLDFNQFYYEFLIFVS